MVTVSADELQTLWEGGESLEYAWLTFSDTIDRDRVQALKIHPDDEAELADQPRFQRFKPWLVNPCKVLAEGA